VGLGGTCPLRGRAKQELTIWSFRTGGPWGRLASGCGSKGFLLLSCWFGEAPLRLPCPLFGWPHPLGAALLPASLSIFRVAISLPNLHSIPAICL
jgi:hypothetical protein